jgi:L,D-transpeptidase YbiS
MTVTFGARRWLPRGRRRWLALAVILFFAVPSLVMVAGYRYRPLAEAEFPAPPKSVRSSSGQLLGRLSGLGPGGRHIVVDVAASRLYLMEGDRVLREAACSAGTGAVLTDPESDRRWVFETPRGVRRVRDKIENPVWREPDWYYIEEGLPIPADASERFDSVAMGDYALDLGDGYFIHGTLYRRLLGRNVTHGCIRLGDDDLAAVFHAVPLGTPVYIY